MVIKDGTHKLVGFIDLGEMHNAFERIPGSKTYKLQCLLI